METQLISRITQGKLWKDKYEESCKKVISDKYYRFLDTDHVEWIKIEGCYYVQKYELIIGDPEVNEFSYDSYPVCFMGMKTTALSSDPVKDLFYSNRDICPFIRPYNDTYYVYEGARGFNRCYVHCSGGCVYLGTGGFYSNGYYINIPMCKLSKTDFFRKISAERLVSLDKDLNIENAEILFEFLEKFISYAEAAEKLNIPADDIMAELDCAKFSEEEAASFKKMILEADLERAGLEADDAKCLDDVNMGHWELWKETENSDKHGPELTVPLVARDPNADIDKNGEGMVGIDFGTKSTIVSFMAGNDIKRLHRIGIGKLSTEAKASHYENPTVMEFINLEKFISEYNSEAGRPHTHLSDLTVSHKAYNSLKSNSDSSDDFYSFFYDIKQWCGDSSGHKQIKLIDKHKNTYILPPYLQLSEDDIDPVEIYAYYLGLYINNMRSGIFLNYMLSFPVAYEKNVKEKLLKSFTKGLKKSLPCAVLDNPDAMEKFTVEQGVSEPAAYAISALRAYGFEPEDENCKFFYGIFDFGGGTADFDFGVWRGAANTREERRYNYVIEHFGSQGDQYLGGENLLEIAAFEIFRDNKEKLLKNNTSEGFTFSKPAECDFVPGSEALISNSQEAKRNIKQLMEKLRPLWEGLTVYDKEKSVSDKSSINGKYMFTNKDISFGETISVDLFDKTGKSVKNVQLNFDKEKIVGLFERRIEKGVFNFFEALKFTMRTHSNKDIDKINIFLAGNSCRSPIVNSCFEKYIEKHLSEFGGEEGVKDFFAIYPPLGTSEAHVIQMEKGISVDADDLYAPTGKTGVALGLLEGRRGGPVKVISEIKADDETKFKYYIGLNIKNKFTVVMNRETEYNEWVNINLPADEDIFELYFTNLPEAATNKMMIEGISKKRCRLSCTDEKADIFIRAVSPTVIEYCAAYPDKTDFEEYVSKPVRAELS